MLTMAELIKLIEPPESLTNWLWCSLDQFVLLHYDNTTEPEVTFCKLSIPNVHF